MQSTTLGLVNTQHQKHSTGDRHVPWHRQLTSQSDTQTRACLTFRNHYHSWGGKAVPTFRASTLQARGAGSAPHPGNRTDTHRKLHVLHVSSSCFFRLPTPLLTELRKQSASFCLREDLGPGGHTYLCSCSTRSTVFLRDSSSLEIWTQRSDSSYRLAVRATVRRRHGPVHSHTRVRREPHRNGWGRGAGAEGQGRVWQADSFVGTTHKAGLGSDVFSGRPLCRPTSRTGLGV